MEAKDSVLNSLIEKASSQFVLLDSSSQEEISGFLAELDSLGKKAAEEGRLVVKEIISAACACVRGIPFELLDKKTEVISFLLNELQILSHSSPRTDPSDYNIDKFARSIDKLLGKTVEEDISLPVSPEEFSEYLSSTEAFLSDIEQNALELEKNMADTERFNAIFRAFHTIKGEAGLLGIINVAQLTHELENMLSHVRSGRIDMDGEILALILNVVDALKELFGKLKSDISAGFKHDLSALKAGIAEMFGRKVKEPASPVLADEAQTVSAADAPLAAKRPDQENGFTPRVPVIDFSEGTEIISEFINESFEHMSSVEESLLALENNPLDADAINKVFREFHTVKGLASFLNLDDIRTLAHDTETVMDLVRKKTLPLTPEIMEVVFAAMDGQRKLLELLKEQIAGHGVLTSPYFDCSPVISSLNNIIRAEKSSREARDVQEEQVKRKIGEILLEKEIISEPQLVEAVIQQAIDKTDKKIGEILVENGALTPEQLSRGLEEQHKTSTVDETVKIGIRKLDFLIDMVGELVISGSQVVMNPLIMGLDNQQVTKNVSQLGKIIRDIQEISMGMRLVSVKPVFQKMQRLVRDLSKKSSKLVDMKFSGENTEIDKTIVDLISDPLMHMVRNSVDHGIENVQLRRSRGKSDCGIVELNAYHKGGGVVIEIKDDGGGLDKERILKKARERGMARESEVYDDNRIFNFIFEPGFSTAEKITDVSGRGVGMDVVKRNIEQLRGKIEITSEPGKGATFKIKLPLTLAIIDGIILEVGAEKFISPLSPISEFVNFKAGDIVSVNNRGEMLKVRDDLFELIRLDKIFGLKAKESSAEDKTACIVESDFGKVCLLVDSILGQQQVVIKSLGGSLQKVKGICGGTILGDGKVGLILDINGIVAMSKE